MIPAKGKEEMTFDEWLVYGITRNWSTAPICETHDGFAKITKEVEAGDCVHYIRLYKDSNTAYEVMDEFPPAAWRSFTRDLK